MSNYTVMEAQEVRRLPAKDNWPEKAVDNYTLKANGSDDLIPVTAFRKLDQSIPKPGDSIEGEVGEPDRFDKDRRKFKLAFKGSGGGFRKRDPKETARIERQHSQEMALRYIAIKAQLGVLPDEPNGKKGFDLSDVFTLADRFADDLEPPPVQTEIPDDPSA